MTSFPSVGKRAEEFADAVEAMLAGVATAPPAAGDTALLELVGALRSVPEPTPRPEFTLALRQQLVAEAAALAATGPVVVSSGGRVTGPLAGSSTAFRGRRSGPRHGRLVAAATALVALGGTAGVASVSQQALPGDPLYPVKRAIEGAELRLSTSDGGRGRDLLHQASHRLEEVEALLPGGGSPLPPAVAATLPATVEAFEIQAVQGSHLLLDAFEVDRDPEVVVEVRTFASQSLGTLTGLAAVAPADVDDELAGAAIALQAVDARALALCGECGEGTAPLEVPVDLGEAVLDGDEDHVEAGGPAGPGELPAGAESPGEATDDGGTVGDPGATDAPTGDPTLPSEPADPTGGTDTPTDGPTDGISGGATGGATDGATDGATGGATDGPSDGTTDGATDGGASSPPAYEPTDEGDGTVDEAVDVPGPTTGGGPVSTGDEPAPSGGPADGATDGPGGTGGGGTGGGADTGAVGPGEDSTGRSGPGVPVNAR